jgi:hypothetical protein
LYANRKKMMAAGQRSLERRKREDETPRLAALFPDLTGLQMAITEHSAAGTSKHVKHVVIARAPSLFIIVCGDERCQEGGHDITHEVMHALRSRRTHHTGDHECGGTTGSAPCTRRIDYEITAKYLPG